MSPGDAFSVGKWLLVAEVKVAALVVAGALGASFWRSSPARVRHALWIGIFAGIGLITAGSLLPARWQVSLPDRVDAQPAVDGPKALPPPALPGDANTLAATETSGSAGGVARVARPAIAWLAWIWLAGALVLLARAAADLAVVAWIAASRRTRQNRHLSADVEHVARRLGLRRIPRIVLSRRISSPMAAGFVSPIILLPESAASWSRARVDAVILHEAIHLARRDPLTTWLCDVVCAVHWPNPAVWAAASRQRLAREQACDEGVLTAGTEPVGYAEHLLGLATLFQRRHAPAGVEATDGSHLRARIAAILAWQAGGAAPRRARAAAATLGVLAAVPLATVSFGRSDPPMVDRQVSTLLAQLADTSSLARQLHAVWALGDLEARSASTALEETMTSAPAAELRALAAWALGEIKDPAALPALSRAAADESAHVREMAARALGELEDTRGIGALERLLRDEAAQVRAGAVWALGEIGTGSTRRAVGVGLADSDAGVRRMAVDVLRGGRARSHLDDLLEALRDSDAHVRRSAAVRLGALRDRAAVPTLAERLEDPVADVRREAARALGRIGDPSAVDLLIRQLRDEDLETRSTVIWALDEVSANARRGRVVSARAN